MSPNRALTATFLLLTGAYLSGCSVVPVDSMEKSRNSSVAESPQPSAKSSKPASPTVEAAMDLLAEGKRPWTMTVIGDSTGNEPDEWVYPVVTAIAEKYGRPVTIHRWDIATHQYIDEVTLGSGSNAPIVVWNGSASGKDGLYSASHFKTLAAVEPDLAVISHGHNMPSAEAARQQIKVLEQMLAGAWQDAPAIAVTIQNPRIDAGKAKMEALSADIKDDWKGTTVKILDVQSAFSSSSSGLSRLLTKDGYHPNDAGQALWAQSVLDSLNVS